jgi:para-nitrobenzyl esterase
VTDEQATVDVQSGRLRGLRRDGVLRFRGIPYAAPTGGINRLQAPQPVTPWSGVRDALQCGHRSMQERETFADTPVLAWYGQSEPLGEDCCVLNVFTPELDSVRRPVMVYIHGGGYVTGGGGGAVLDGGHLARFGDVVVVTVNHRLSVFGYLNLGHIDADLFGDAANAGQLDLIAALHWVRCNIAQFGGDPSNVTLFGQSGGGSKITVLMGMPAAKGLFHRAINMSGVSGMHVSPAAGTVPYADAVLDAAGVGRRQLRALQHVPAALLLKAREVALKSHPEGSRPVLDGRHIPAGAMTPEGLRVHASVPLLMGTVDTEATFYFRTDMRNFHVDARQVKARICAQFGLDDAQAQAVMDAYREDAPERTPADILVALVTDTLFRVPMLHAAEAKAGAGKAPVYLYNFTWKSPVDGGVWGAPHTIDIPFAFGNNALSTSLTGIGSEPGVVSRNLMAAFVAFARTGNPENPHMPAWKPYDAQTRATMTVDVDCRAVNDFRGADRRASAALRMDPFNRSALVDYRD